MRYAPNCLPAASGAKHLYTRHGLGVQLSDWSTPQYAELGAPMLDVDCRVETPLER